MRYGLVYLALLVYALALLGALSAPQPAPAATAEPAIAATRPAASAPAPLPVPVIGFAINLHHTDHLELYLHAIDEMAAMGFNTLEVLTPAFQRDGAADDIRVDVAPGQSPRREDLVKLLRYARDKGLTTKLMPLVLFSHPRGNEWRGKIQPEHWDRWWDSYRKNIDHFTDIANETGVSIFSVGSELLSTEKDTRRWEDLIAHVRTRFAGKLSYSTNWDHYTVPTFWHDLDIIGINGYWDLTGAGKNEHPDQAVLGKAWRDIRKDVLDFGAATGKPVLLTEIGYPSLPWGLKDPWNYVNTTDDKSDPKAQADGYAAFLDTWKEDLAHPDPKRFVGVCFFEWDVYHDGGPDDTGYGVRGKPAYDLLKNWLATRDAATQRSN